MKKIYILLNLTLLSLSINAQSPICNYFTPYKEEASQILQNLDKSHVTTGTLYEEVFPWADIEVFDGTVQADTSTNYHYFQAYSELFYSTYNNYSYTPSKLRGTNKEF